MRALPRSLIDSAVHVFTGAAVTARMLLGANLFKLLPGDEKFKRRRMLDSLTVVLGELDGDDEEALGVKLAQEEKPKSLPTEETKLATRLAKCGLDQEKTKFYTNFLAQCLRFHSSERITSFRGFHQLYQQATEQEKKRMPALTPAEKEEADEECGGLDNAGAGAVTASMCFFRKNSYDCSPGTRISLEEGCWSSWRQSWGRSGTALSRKWT